MLVRPPRLRFDGIDRVAEGDSSELQVTVRLSFNEQVYKGYSYGQPDSNQIELAARACLKAVEDFVQHRFNCSLLETDQVNTLGRQLIVLLVKVYFENREIQIFGSCRVQDDLLEAGARAALDATNRYVELVMANRDATALKNIPGTA